MKILSIVGFGGQGKTTLAKAVYGHLKPRFECQAFVPVGQNPDIKKVFGDILIALDEQTYTRPKLLGLDENQLMGKLNEFVKEKRCLIVIDDIWDKKTWKLVRCALQESNCGSRLVITTRIYEVAAYADEAYKIQPLSHDNSEKLLYARIDDGEGKYFDSLSAETCERILKKCGGVPLAIKGAFLAEELPEEVGLLTQLVCLRAGHWDYSWIDELPEEVGLLTQLVCLRADDYAIRVPAGFIGKLTSLQELRISCRGKDAIIMQFVEELGLLKELRVLKITRICRSESIESALLESLGHLHNIQELQIGNYSLSKYRVSEAGSLSYCRHLRLLHLDRLVFSALPAWINSSLAPNLSYLDVQVVVVKDQDMETLAKLPELSCLILHLTGTKLVSVKLLAEGVGYFRKLRFLKILGSLIRFDVRGSECNSSRVPSNNTIMPGLESLEFGVHVRSLKDEKLQLGFDKMLGFQNLGTSSLQRVKAEVNCGGASTWDVEEAEAALEHAAAVHPKHPTLLTNRVESQYMISRYQEV
ncbi:uncharacterized protein [Miscanthus floridulus]|uniref:uncharacterized protein n=1 Tax=Miscanthus floridulus TaxID=154761 RepID=UPI003459E082